MQECFFAKKLKWLPKANHYVRYYRNGICCAILDHNENADRDVKAERWMRGETLRKGGRWYKQKVRAPTTDHWRTHILSLHLEQAQRRTMGGALVVPPAVVRSYVVNDTLAVQWKRAAMLPARRDAPQQPPARPTEPVVVGGAAPAPDASVASVITAEDPGDGDHDRHRRGEEDADWDEVANASPTDAEQKYMRLLSVAAEATAAALLQDSGGSRLVEYSALASEDVARLKNPQLLDHLQQRGLPTTGKKADYVQRLLEWIADQDDAASDVSDDEDDAPPVNRSGRDAALLARRAGVSLEWHLFTCPRCKAQLTARLSAASNAVECSYCHTELDCANRDVAAHPLPVAKPLAYRKRGPSQRFRNFMSKTMSRLIAEARSAVGEDAAPLAGRLQRNIFSRAMEEWHRALESGEFDDDASGRTAGGEAGGSGDAGTDAGGAGMSDVEMADETPQPRLPVVRTVPLVPTAIPLDERPKKKRRVTKETEVNKDPQQPCRSPLTPLLQPELPR